MGGRHDVSMIAGHSTGSLQSAYSEIFAEIKKPLFKGLFVAYKRALCTALVAEVISPECLF